MNSKTNICFSLLLAVLITAATLSAGQSVPGVGGFILNKGQWPNHIVALARDKGMDVWISRTDFTFDHHRYADGQRQGHVVRIHWDGATTESAIETGNQLPLKVNFIHGNDPAKWVTDVPIVDRVVLRNMYPGVDAVYRMDNGHVRYDVAVAPFANPRQVSLSVDGAASVSVQPRNVTLRTSLGEISMDDLFSYQFTGTVIPVQTEFLLSPTKPNQLLFTIAGYNVERPLIIDPVVYATYLGGHGNDNIAGLKVLSNGNVVVGGTTNEPLIPAATGGYSLDIKGSQEGFVAILDKPLSRLLALTYIGGGNDDRITALTTDADGNVYITGETTSTDFPMGGSTARGSHSGMIDAFIAKLNPALSKLLIGSYVGGNRDDKATSIAIDKDRNIYICGSTLSTLNFPVTNGFQKTHGGQLDGFVTKLTNTGASFTWSTYYGKTGNESFNAIYVDGTSAPYLAGWTDSPDFETFPKRVGGGPWGGWSGPRARPFQPSYGGGNSDAVLVRFGFDGSSPTFATYYGGTGAEVGKGVFADDLGRPYLIGETDGATLFESDGGVYPQHLGGIDIFLSQFSADGRDNTITTYFGGSGNDYVSSAAIDGNNNAVVTGVTTSVDFRMEGAGSNNTRNGPNDPFIAVFSPNAVKYASVYELPGEERVGGGYFTPRGDVYFAGSTTGNSITPTDMSLQASRSGGDYDGFIARWSAGSFGLASPSGGQIICKGRATTVSWVVQGMLQDEEYSVQIQREGETEWATVADKITNTQYAWTPSKSLPDGKYILRATTLRGHRDQTDLPITLIGSPDITQLSAQGANMINYSIRECAGKAVVLSVSAAGDNLKYQWNKGGAPISSATNATLQVTISENTVGTYEVIVTGACTPGTTSSPITISIAAATNISQQPESKAVKITQPATFIVAAVGEELTYQWFFNGNAINNEDARKASLTIPAVLNSDEGEYHCEVTGKCGTVKSSTVTLSITTSVESETASGFAVILPGPHPAGDELNVAVRMPATQLLTFLILDLNGRTLQRFDGTVDNNIQHTQSLTTEFLTNGTYILEVQNGRERVMTPFIVYR